MNKSKPGFFQRLFQRDDSETAPTSLELRVEALERTIRAAVREWDDALDLLTRKAGRANRLLAPEPAPPASRVELLNEEIRAKRRAYTPTNGSTQ